YFNAQNQLRWGGSGSPSRPERDLRYPILTTRIPTVSCMLLLGGFRSRDFAFRAEPSCLGVEHPVHGEPTHEGIEPAGAGRFLGVHAEAVTALLIKVKFDRLFSRAPALDQP